MTTESTVRVAALTVVSIFAAGCGGSCGSSSPSGQQVAAANPSEADDSASPQSGEASAPGEGSESGGAREHPAAAATDTAGPDGATGNGDASQGTESVKKVPPVFVFDGDPYANEAVSVRATGSDDTEVPVLKRPRVDATQVDTLQIRRGERIDFGEERIVHEADTRETPASIVIKESAEHVAGPERELPLHIERGNTIAAAREDLGEGTYRFYIWYDGTIYFSREFNRAFELANPEVMESDAGFANRTERSIRFEDDDVFEALGLLRHGAFFSDAENSSWWRKVQGSDSEGWVRMDGPEIRVEACYRHADEKCEVMSGGDD